MTGISEPSSYIFSGDAQATELISSGTNGPFPFYHHSLKEHPMFSKIAKFGCEML